MCPPFGYALFMEKESLIRMNQRYYKQLFCQYGCENLLFKDYYLKFHIEIWVLVLRTSVNYFHWASFTLK